MKKRTIIFLTALLFFQISSAQVVIPKAPIFGGDYHDYINFLPESTASLLDRKIATYSSVTSTEILIVVIDSTKGEDVLELATRWGNEWGIGQYGNGILFLVAARDREIAIATGEKVRKKLTDSYVKKIIDNRIVPAFKKESYYKGLDDGLDNIFKVLTKSQEEIEILEEKENLYIKILKIGPFLLIVFFGFYLATKSGRLKSNKIMNSSRTYASDGVVSGGGIGGSFGGGFGSGGASGSW